MLLSQHVCVPLSDDAGIRNNPPVQAGTSSSPSCLRMMRLQRSMPAPLARRESSVKDLFGARLQEVS